MDEIDAGKYSFYDVLRACRDYHYSWISEHNSSLSSINGFNES